MLISAWSQWKSLQPCSKLMQIFSCPLDHAGALFFIVLLCSTVFYYICSTLFYYVLLCSTMFYYVLFYLYPVHSFRCLSSMAGFRVGAAMMADGRAKRVHLPFGKELPL